MASGLQHLLEPLWDGWFVTHVSTRQTNSINLSIWHGDHDIWALIKGNFCWQGVFSFSLDYRYALLVLPHSLTECPLPMGMLYIGRTVGWKVKTFKF